MKKIIIICLSALVSTGLYSQEEKVKQREFGIGMANLNSFALLYKCGHQGAMWRLQSLIANGKQEDYTNKEKDSLFSKSSNLYLRFQAGREWRTDLGGNFEFRYGLDLTFRYNSTTDEYNTSLYNSIRYDNLYKSEQTTLEPGICFVLGVNYVVKEKWVIGAEVCPGFNYITGTRVDEYYPNPSGTGEPTKQEFDISGYEFGLRNTGALLSVSYRFIKS